MRVHIPMLGVPGEEYPVQTLSGFLAASDRHQHAESPDEADIVLFSQVHLLGSDWREGRISASELARSAPEKVFVYDERDRPWCRYPGIYVSMPRDSFHPEWQVSSGYYSCQGLDLGGRGEPDLLYSFIGSPSVPVREAIYQLTHSRGHVERTDGFVFFDSASVRFAERKQKFSELMGRSKFILCPRGRGVNSIRLYETIASGRIPVILSDHWVPMAGPNWDDFSIRWPEKDVAQLPKYLESRESDVPTMTAAVTKAHQEWFRPDNQFLIGLDRLASILPRRSAFPDRGIHDRAWRDAGMQEAIGRARQAAVRVKRIARDRQK